MPLLSNSICYINVILQTFDNYTVCVGLKKVAIKVTKCFNVNAVNANNERNSGVRMNMKEYEYVT